MSSSDGSLASSSSEDTDVDVADKDLSSRGDGVTSAPLLEPILRSHFALAFFARILKLKVRLNIHISLI